MNKESVIDALVTLANGMESRSKNAQLRGIYPYIEAAKRAGLTNSKIVETLNAQGLELTLRSFEMHLYRIRKSGLANGNDAMPLANTQKKEGPIQHQTTPPSQTGSNTHAEMQLPSSEELAGLDKKQRRERLGEQFIPREHTSPFLKRIKDQHQ